MSSNEQQYESQVAVPHEYFHNMSKMDYNNPHVAFVRELFQNSVDAGCKNFILVFDRSTNEVVAIDDGCGMTEDIIRNRLLVMGGTHKDSQDAIGAFGHAKVLIYFSWESYEIRTNNIRVIGKSNHYSISKLDPNDVIKGTVSTIKISEEVDFDKITRCKDFFEYCETNVIITRIIIDKNGDEEFVSIFRPKLVKEICIPIESDFMSIYIGSDIGEYSNQYVYIRSNGVLMFNNWSNVLKRPIVVETKGSARDLFTQNRDSFKREYASKFQELITRINNDNVSMTNAALQNFFNKNIPTVDKRKKDGERKLKIPVENGKFISWGKTKAEWKLYFKKRKIKNIKYFMEHVVNEYKTFTNTQDDIMLGFVFDPSVDGVMVGTSNLFINPISIDLHRKNKRKMIYVILDIICHELAHFETLKHEGYSYHNEGFVGRLHKIKLLFWDVDFWYKEYKKCCANS